MAFARRPSCRCNGDGRMSRLTVARLPLAPQRTIPTKVADPFYSSTAYRAWRKLVIERAGGACQSPGCGKREGRMFADHIVERRDGGSDLDPANGQALCAHHHQLKTCAERARRYGARA